jgi:hypothetical protein
LNGTFQTVVLAHGDLKQGQLAFDQFGGIGGEVDVSVQIGAQKIGEFDIKLQHTAGDYGSGSLGMTLSNGAATATFVPLQHG